MALCTGLAVLVVMVGLSSSEYPGGQFISTNNEILSAITWATLDPKLFTQQSMMTSLHDLNTTQFTYNDYNEIVSKPRRTRAIELKPTSDLYMDLEIRFIIPLLEVYESSFFRFEVPINYNLHFPKLDVKEGRAWDTTLAPMITHLEDLISMMGVDGGICVQRAVCELAAAPSLQVHGLVGELVHILLRHITEDSLIEDPESNNIDASTDSKNPSVSKGDYIKAGEYGRQKGNCWSVYSECPVSLFNLLASS